MGRFDRQIATAQRLIKTNGEVVTYRIVRDGEATNPDEPWKPTNAVPVEKQPVICFLPIDKDTQRTLMLQANSDVPICNEMGLMGAVDFEPDMKDVIVRSGKEYRIFAIDILRPNGQPILYTFYFNA